MNHLKLVWLLLLISLSQVAWAEWSYSGHASLLLNQTLYEADDIPSIIGGGTDYKDIDSNLRLNLKRQWQDWDFTVQYQVAVMTGDSIKLPASVSPFSSGKLGSDAGRLWNLSSELRNDASGLWLHRLDRLNLGYTSGDWAVRVGRQAISWGNGISFHPLDIFNPFSPLSLDTEYKTGDDMVYLQRSLPQQRDLQIIYLPRRDTLSGVLDGSKDSLAMKLHSSTAQGDWDLLLARHYNEQVYGIAYVRNVTSAVWRTDINMTQLNDGRTAWFVDSNMDYSWNWFEHNFYGYVEWFHNSLGQKVPDLIALASDTALLDRIQRGELYTLADNVFALGMMMELTPRWQTQFNLLHHPADGGAILHATLHHDWQQNASLLMGMSLPAGPRGSEYGGVYSEDAGAYFSSGQRLFLYVQYYY